MSNQLKSNILRDIDTLIREIHALYEFKFKSYDLQRGQFIFLTRIYENPGISLSDLSYELKMDKTTITRAIQKLIDAKYIKKQQDNIDKRLWHLYALDKCTKIYDDIIAEKNKIMSTCFKDVNADDIEIFDNVVNKISKNINIEWNKSINKKLGE